jgi:hypothetical protein
MRSITGASQERNTILLSIFTGLREGHERKIRVDSTTGKEDTLRHQLTSMGSHLVVLVSSAGIALSLPWIAREFLAFWTHVEHATALLMGMEVAVAAVVILFGNFVRRSLRDSRTAKIANDAGLVACVHAMDTHSRHRIAASKSQQGVGRPLRVIGFTGFSTFADPGSDLHPVVQNCLEARILLANPFSEAVQRRVKQQPDPVAAWNRVCQEVQASVQMLKSLKDTGKPLKLKLYWDLPLVRLAILGEHVWLQSYHTNLEVGTRPEYVFQHDRQEHGLYALWYQYFLKQWTSPALPEYDFDRDELVYREDGDGEVRREPFHFSAENSPFELESYTGQIPQYSP